MAGSINRIIIGGRLGADPEIRNVSDLKRVAKLSVATSESWTNADGEPTESDSMARSGYLETCLNRFRRAQSEEG